jgi:phosphatidylserine decarboxylase
MNKFSVKVQYLMPQHLFSKIMGKFSHIRTPWFKNWMIQRFIKKYNVDMSTAVIEDPSAYENFNQFFTRQLKPQLRPITDIPQSIASPVDGTAIQMSRINKNLLLQAKRFYYDLHSLLGGDNSLAELFHDGSFATLYLAPRDYHRVHMPLSGQLKQVIYIPGKLFSVNQLTSECIPNLFSRNERLITLFDTEAGPMAVILVGAMIVGSIQTVWMDHPIRDKDIRHLPVSTSIQLAKGAELGHFTLGSTVILLFGKNAVSWATEGGTPASLKMGQLIGKVNFLLRENH